MKRKKITESLIHGFVEYLKEDEKQQATIDKYIRDINRFKDFVDSRSVDKRLVLEYKMELGENYAVSSANSMLAAMNVFFAYAGWQDCCVKRFKVQKQAYCSEEKELSREEYFRLLKAAEDKNDNRLKMIMQTICSTGIRVSELEFITVEAVRRGEAEVICKGKARRIFIINLLKERLQEYIDERNIVSGPIFITRTGKPVSRSNIWRQMKELCEEAEVCYEKIYPHNLRHLFARSFYDIEKDIVKLADVLGHANINTTRIYTITTGIEHRRKMESMQLII